MAEMPPQWATSAATLIGLRDAECRVDSGETEGIGLAEMALIIQAAHDATETKP